MNLNITIDDIQVYQSPIIETNLHPIRFEKVNVTFEDFKCTAITVSNDVARRFHKGFEQFWNFNNWLNELRHNRHEQKKLILFALKNAHAKSQGNDDYFETMGDVFKP